MEVGYDRLACGNAANTSIQEEAKLASGMHNYLPQNDQDVSDDPDLESWDPMKEDYSNLAFNAYREPTTQELRQWMPKPGNSGPSEDLMACYRSRDGDVRLFINGLPNDLTQEGVKGLFSQVGKVVYCRVIPQRDPSRVDKFGFVGYKSYREAEHAIRKFDGFNLGRNNLKLRVSLAKEKPKLPETFPSMEDDVNFTNALEETVENTDPDWGRPATPVNLNTHMNGESSVQQGPPGQGHFTASLNQESPVNAEASACNGEAASKKPIAAGLEPLPCSKCGKEGRRRCGNCKIPYCSKECQRSHWPEHKKFCNRKTAGENSNKNFVDTSLENALATTPNSSQTNGHDDNEIDRSPSLNQGSILSSSQTNGHKENGSEEQPSLNQGSTPSSSQANAHSENDNEERPSTCTNQGSTPNQDPCLLNEDDLEFSDISQFVNMLGIKFVPVSPGDSPSPQNVMLSKSEGSGSPLPLQQEPHYGYLQPLRRDSPRPLITEISSSVSESEDSQESSSRTTPIRDQASMSVGATSSVVGPQSEDQSVMTTNNRKTSEEPQKRPYKRYSFDEVPQQNLSIAGSYEIVTTSVSSPRLFWAQLYEESALASQNYLYETIRAEYENTVYTPYVPSPNELCIAQFSVDNNWYRSKVDYICNNGLIRVTHIDFGSSEDVEPSKIRRIKEDLVRVPRQGIKFALNLSGCPELSREWSSETIEAFISKVLDVKCRVEVKKVKDSVLYVDVFDSTDNTKINDIFNVNQQEGSTLAKPVPMYPQSSHTNTDTAERNSTSSNLKLSSLERAEDTLPSSRGTSPSPPITTHVSANPATHVSGIARKDNDSPVMRDYSTNVPGNRVSPMFGAGSAFSPIKSPLANPSGGAGNVMKTPEQETSGFYSEMPTSPETYYTSPSNPTHSNPDCKTSENNTDDPISGQESPYPASVRSTSSHSSSKSSSEVDLQLRSPEPRMQQNTGVVHGLPFKGVITSVKSPWEFTVKLSDSQFTAQFESLNNDLNIYCGTAPFEVQKVYSHGEMCAVKNSEDKTWQRGKVLANFQQEGYKVVFIDLGGEKVLAAQNMRTMPDQFKGLEPQCRICSLGGVRKPTGSLIWGREATDRFTSLVLYRSFTFKEISRYKYTYIVDVLDETGQPSVAMELINSGLAGAFVKKLQRLQDAKEKTNPMLPKGFPLPIKIAITSAKLPPPNTIIQIMATDIQSPASFSVQLVDKEANQSLSVLCAEMNKYYTDSTPHPDWKPRESEMCAVFCKGSWFRAYIEGVDQDNAAKIYCVDFGNSEVVSPSVLRPLAPTFQSLAYCALRCSLGNIVPVEGDEWSKQVTDFMKLKIPISSTLSARLIYKGQSILFLDVFVSTGKNTESILKVLVTKGLAKFKSKNEARSPSATTGMARNRFEDKFDAHKSGNTPYSLSVDGCAIAAAKLPDEGETFEGIVIELKATGEFYVQIADEALAVQLMEMTNAMSSYYSKATPTKFEAKQNLLCAAKFSTDWRRAYILEVNSNKTATVYDVDFGKIEILPVSQLQFLQSQFTALQYLALICKVSLPRGVNWTKEARDLFLSKVKFLVPITIRLHSRRKEILFVDCLIPESSQTLSQMIVSQNQERKPAVEGWNRGPKPTCRYPTSPKMKEAENNRSVPSGQVTRSTPNVKSLNFEKAIAAVTLPRVGETFNAVITEFRNPQSFFIHSDIEMATKLTNLAADMNNHYNTVPKAPFQPDENLLCVAPFGSPNDWYRALVEKINANQIANVFFVDYGNTDEIPVTDLRPLEDRFSVLPYCALNSSLANVKPMDLSGWTSGANDFVKSKLPVGVGLSLKLISKRQHILYVDLVDPTSGEGSLCSDLVKNGLALNSSGNREMCPSSSRSSSLSSQKLLPSARESAIASASLPPFKEAFQVIATHITSPGSFAVQVADFEMACKVAALGNEMNAHYQSTQYHPFSPATSRLCAAHFTGNDEWYRGWIESIVSHDKVHVYYTDYGNSEVLGVSRLRPLEKQFTELPFSALPCSIAHVVPQDQGEWKQEAIDLFTTSVPLYQPINVKLVYKKRDCLFLDIIDPNEISATLSKTLVERGLAAWMQPSKRQTNEVTEDNQSKPKYNESKKARILSHDRSSDSEMTPPLLGAHGVRSPSNPSQEIPVKITNDPAPVNKYFLPSIPMVVVPTDEFFNAMVCDIKKTGAVSLQVLTKELKDLDALCLKICNHCSQDDHSPYCPVEGELCLACFSQDKNWYRAVVSGVLPNNLFKVTFIDFGNDDTVSPSDVRKVKAEFLGLPTQAYTGFLAGFSRSDMGVLLEDDVVKALSDRLLDKRVFARVSGSTSEVEFFDVGNDEKPAGSVNKEVLPRNAVNTTQNKQSSSKPVEKEFTALVSEVIGTSEIWLHRKDESETLNILKTDLDSYCESSSSVPLAVLPRHGDICLCKFSIDRSWYRARVVESISPDNILVLFVDYGNTEVVTLNSLREPKPEFMQFPFQGIKCYLFGITQGNPDADDYVQQILNRELMVKVRERGAEALGVELEDYGVPNGPFNINEILIGFGHSA